MTANVDSSDLKKAQEKVLGSTSEDAAIPPTTNIINGSSDLTPGAGSSNAEPPSGMQGAGTAAQPYDQGNQPGMCSPMC